MAGSEQNTLERIKDQMDRGLLSAAEANVALVRANRVRVVTAGIPREVRKALNEAVKQGVLAHIKKAGHKPETYYHPAFEYLAREARNKHEASVSRALVAVCAAGNAADR